MRRKITMLFVALLACVGVMKADVTDLPQISTVEKPIYYTIMNTRSSQPGGLMYYAGDNVGLKDEQAIVLENKHKFFFTGSHEEMYVHNAATGLKLASVGSWTEAGTAWAVGVSPKGGGLAFGPKGGLNSNSCWNEKNFATDANTSDFTTWSANDDGSIFIVDLVEDYVFPMTDLFYVIESPLFEKVQGVKKAIYVNAEGKAVWGTEDLKNNNFYWIPTVDAEGKTVALKNLGTGTYLSKADGTMTTEAATATLKILGDCSFNINIGGTLHAAGHDNGKGGNGSLTSWGGSIGSASAWRFVQKNDPNALEEVVVNYSFTYGGEEKYIQTSNTFVDEEYPAFTIELPFGVLAEKPKGVISAEDATGGTITKVIELSVNLPFTYAADYASIENWYYMNIHTDHYYLNYEKDATIMALAATTVPADQKDAYSWAFIGNPFDGYQIVNKVAGEGYILSSSTTMEGNNGGATYPILTATPVDEGNNTHWIPTASSHRENGFFLAQKNNASNRMNRRDGKLAYWTTGADAGSAFVVELRDDAAALRQLVASAQEYLENLGVGTAVGCVTADSKTAISNAIATANTAIANKTGYDDAQANLQTAIASVKTIQPEAGKFYTIVSSCTDDHRAGQEVYVNIDGGMQFARVGEVASETARVFQFVPAADGKFYLYNIECGVYMQSVGTATETDVTKAKPVTISNLGAANIVKIVPDGQNMMHAQDSGSKIVGWNNNSTTNGSAWTIAEADFSLTALTHTLTVTEAGWATLVLGYNTTIPANAKVYAVSAINDGSVTLAEVENVLPAHTPVLVEAAAGDYVFNYTATAAAVESNLLAGSVFNVTVEGPGYILGNGSEGIGLYSVKLTNGKFTNGANKAYLPASAVANENAAMFSFGRGEGTTGIDNSQLTIDNVVIYDLTGRRVEKMEKGIYIVNGKKVVIR